MDTNRTNIIFLYTELQPYVTIVIKELAIQPNVNVHVFHWDKKRLTPYEPPEIVNVQYYKRSEYNGRTLYQKVEELNPSIVYTSGWMDKTYMSVCKKIRGKYHIPIVAGSDSQWRGRKQWINVFLSPFFHRHCFSHIQVSGVWQYEYARRLGFSKSQILMHNYSADISIFNKVDIESKTNAYPKRMIFIGRFAPEKGLKFLLEAWKQIDDKKGWTLTFIGNGPEKESLAEQEKIEVLDYIPQELLVEQLQNTGCFILPSIFEPWALVLHEAAAAGLPILASDICGAVPYFVLNNYNGFTFRPGNVGQIKSAIEKIISSEENNLLKMSRNSRKLAQKITPEIVAQTFLSVLQ